MVGVQGFPKLRVVGNTKYHFDITPQVHNPENLNPKFEILKPYTLHPTPYTPHPTPYNLRPTPYNLNPKLYTLHPKPYTLSP